MRRSITFHELSEFENAAVHAYEWVIEKGGTMLFLLKRDKVRCIPYVMRCASRGAKSKPNESLHIECTYGDDFMLYGPRVAAISIDELGMSRIEERIRSESYVGEIEELRAYARKPDKHPNWTRNSQVESLDRQDA